MFSLTKKILPYCMLLGAIPGLAQDNSVLIVPPHAPFQKEFGHTIAIGNQNRIAIGSEFDNGSGTIFFYEGKTFKWQKTGKSVDPDAGRFGVGLAFDQSTLAVGAPTSFKNNKITGKVFIFSGSNHNYELATPLQVLDRNVEQNGFGGKIAINNEYLIIGATTANTVYIYKKEGPSTKPWVLKDSIIGNGVGKSFALTSNYLVLGQQGSVDQGTKGSVRIFQKVWNGFAEKITYRNTSATATYGSAVDFYTDLIAVSDPKANKAEVLKYDPATNKVSLVSSIQPPANTPGSDAFGREKIVLKGNYLAVLDQFFYGGRVYLYQTTSQGNPYTFKNLQRLQNILIPYTKVGDISLNDEGYIATSVPHTKYPGKGLGSNAPNDRGVAFFGYLPDLTRDSVSAYEYNNDPGNAKTIEAYEPKYAAIGAAGDVDFYKFTLKSSETVSIQLSELVRNYNLELYNANNVLVKASSNSGSLNELITAPLAAGTYYLKIFGVANVFGKELYRLLLTTGSCAELPGTPNNSLSASAYLNQSLGSPIYGALRTSGEADWYRIIDFKGGLQISLTDLSQDFDVDVFEKGLTRIAVGYTRGTGSEFINLPNLSFGEYYIKISGFNGASSPNCYTLDVTLNYSSREGQGESLIENGLSRGTFSVQPAIVKSDKSLTAINSGIEGAQKIAVMEAGTGRIVLEKEVSATNHSFDLQLPELPSGMYIILAGENDKAKFIIE